MFPDFTTIKLLYSWNALTPTADWYVAHNYLTADQYKTITGKDYVVGGEES